MDTHTTPSPERLRQLAWGFAPPLVLHAAARHRLLDPLVHGPRAAAELAGAAALPLRGVAMILDALTGLRFLTRSGGRYELTSEGAAFLVSTSPTFHGPYLEHLCAQLLPQWLPLAEVVRTGRPVARTNAERDGGEHFARFVESLFPLGEPLAQAVGAHLGLAAVTTPVTVLDVGAGSGVWGITLARLSPNVRVRAVDFPAVLAVTQALAARQGVADRLTPVAGDFLEADLGEGHAVAALGHILHSEGPERNRQLLRRVFAALAPGGTVVITEFVPADDRSGPAQPLLFAVNMLVNTEAGGTYTLREIGTWLGEAGFTNLRQIPVPGAASVILADRPGR
jgi:predicted O-methyltransferase YrrM